MAGPTRADLDAAKDGTVQDVIAPGLKVLFCGINPSLYSAVVQHHFARPGNRFWPTLHRAGFTERVLKPHETKILLASGCGITNVVARATARADELSKEELIEGGEELVEKLERYRPNVLAILGITAYRAAFGRPKAKMGEQPDPLGGVRVWVLPNPSGLNAHYQIDDLARLYRDMRESV